MRLHWRIWFWVGDWIKLVECAVGILTFTYYRPCWWGRFFDWYINSEPEVSCDGWLPVRLRQL